MVLGAVLWVPFCVFLEGSWLVKQFNGFVENPYWTGSLFIPIGWLLWSLRKQNGKIEQSLKETLPLSSYFALTLLGIYSMASKVGARFLEIPFLFIAGFLTLGFVRLRRDQQIVFILLWVTLGTGQIWQSYLKPSIEERQVSTTFRLTYPLGTLMRDSSQDFLSKMKYVRRLSEEGCRIGDILPDSQWYELRIHVSGGLAASGASLLSFGTFH